MAPLCCPPTPATGSLALHLPGDSCGWPDQRLEQAPHLLGVAGPGEDSDLRGSGPWWLTKVSQGTGSEKSPSWLVEAGTASEATGWALARFSCPQLPVTVMVSNCAWVSSPQPPACTPSHSWILTAAQEGMYSHCPLQLRERLAQHNTGLELHEWSEQNRRLC